MDDIDQDLVPDAGIGLQDAVEIGTLERQHDGAVLRDDR